MRTTQFLLCLAAIGVWACGSQPAVTGGDTRAGALEITATMPPGDALAGRQAFQDLRCTACHAVPSEADFQAPVSANPGPPIDARLAAKDLTYLATAIISPSHEMSLDTPESVRAHLQGVLSPMGDFSDVMTVRQFVDLHAFVRSLK